MSRSRPAFARLRNAITGNGRTTLWGAVIALTVGLLLYPKDPEVNFAAIQSLSAFADLPLFGALYYLWALSLVTLTLSLKRQRSGYWEGLVLVGLFALVFRGIWDIPFPVQTLDGVANATTTKAIADLHEVPVGHPNFVYTDFPGIHLLTACLSQVTGLGLSDSVMAIMVLLDLLLAALYYLTSLRILGDQRLAAFAALLAMQGNIVFARLFFYAGFMGLIFIGLFLLLILKKGDAVFARVEDAFAAVVLLGAGSMTHFVSALVPFFLLAGIYLARSFAGRPRAPLLATTPVLYVIVPLSWLIFWSVGTFDNIVVIGSKVQESLAPDMAFRYMFNIGRANLGPTLPPWATATNNFWLFLLFGLGSVSVLLGLVKMKKLNGVEAKATGAFLGVILLALLVTSLYPGGQQVYRFLTFAPFFAAPFLLLLLRGLRPRRALLSLTILALLFVGLSLPTFFANSAYIGVSVYHPVDSAPGQFLKPLYDDGRGLRIMSLAFTTQPLIRYLPEAEYSGELPAEHVQDEEQFWQFAEKQVGSFEGTSDWEAVYVSSPRPVAAFQHIFGIAQDDPNWSRLSRRLEEKERFYDNGQVQMYRLPPQP